MMSLMPGAGGFNGMRSPAPLPVEEVFAAAAQQAAAEEENMRTMEWVKMVVFGDRPGILIIIYARLELATSSGSP